MVRVRIADPKSKVRFLHRPPDFMIKCPTLKGRLKHPLTTEEDAVKQLVEVGGVELSDYAKKILARIEKKVLDKRKKV